MKAVCWMGKSKLETLSVPDPQILNPHDAIIKITRTAICGSDLHLFVRWRPATFLAMSSWEWWRR
jgi:threonine dehydrogenase-like Zn-dependent dehydrogenase